MSRVLYGSLARIGAHRSRGRGRGGRESQNAARSFGGVYSRPLPLRMESSDFFAYSTWLDRLRLPRPFLSRPMSAPDPRAPTIPMPRRETREIKQHWRKPVPAVVSGGSRLRCDLQLFERAIHAGDELRAWEACSPSTSAIRTSAFRLPLACLHCLEFPCRQASLCLNTSIYGAIECLTRVSTD